MKPRHVTSPVCGEATQLATHNVVRQNGERRLTLRDFDVAATYRATSRTTELHIGHASEFCSRLILWQNNLVPGTLSWRPYVILVLSLIIFVLNKLILII